MRNISIEELSDNLKQNKPFHAIHCSPVVFNKGDALVGLRYAQLKTKRLYHQLTEQIMEKARIKYFPEYLSRLQSAYLLPIDEEKNTEKIMGEELFRPFGYTISKNMFLDNDKLDKVSVYRALIDPTNSRFNYYNGDWEVAIVAALMMKRKFKNDMDACGRIDEYIEQAAKNYWGKVFEGPYAVSPGIGILAEHAIVDKKIGEISREEFLETHREYTSGYHEETLPEELKSICERLENRMNIPRR